MGAKSAEPSKQQQKQELVAGTSKCGWCITNEHKTCKVSIETPMYIWFCGCSCNEEQRKKHGI